MEATVVLEDELVSRAGEYTGLTDPTALLREALKALIEREAARKMARLGGSQPNLKPIPRRRSKPG